MNHRQIDAFRAVMITGTATGAAVLLHTTQPVISKQIAELQRRTRVKLFELRKSRLVPTPEAQLLFRAVERSYIGLEYIEQTLVELHGGGSGRINVGALPSFGIGVLPRIVKIFTTTHPQAKLSIETMNSSVVKQGVATGKLDLGITLSDIDTAGVEATPLATVDMVCVMAADHPLAKRKSLDVADIQGCPLIAPTRDSASRFSFDKIFADRGFTPTVVAETTYAVNICFLALQGVGMGLVSGLIAEEFLPMGLVAKPLDPAFRVDLILLLSSNYPPSRLTELLIADIRQFFHRPI
jgi:DNA-binding transcriptional LysR family regulator